jgi:hypothetical protein
LLGTQAVHNTQSNLVDDPPARLDGEGRTDGSEQGDIGGRPAPW